LTMFSKGIVDACAKLDDDDDFMLMLFHNARHRRRVKWRYERINWDRHLEELRHTNKFQSRYHMSEEAFDRLVGILRQQVGMDELQSMRSTGGNDPITPEMTVAAGLRYLGGSLVKDIADIYGMHDKTRG